LRLRSARAGLDGHDRVQVIVFAGEQRARLEFRDKSFGVIQLGVQILQQLFSLRRVRLLAREFNIRFNVACDRSQFGVGANLVFGAFAFAQNSLRFSWSSQKPGCAIVLRGFLVLRGNAQRQR